MNYNSSKYLIYNCFTTDNIGGSLLLDFAQTEEEANEKIAMYKERIQSAELLNVSVAIPRTLNSCKQNTVTRFCFIKNKREWWSSAS